MVSWINSFEKFVGCCFLLRGFSSSGGCSFCCVFFCSDLLDMGVFGVVEGVYGVGLCLSVIFLSGVFCLDSGI